MALNNPQSVMDLVNVKLPNTDAYSSIRGVYGGVGLTLFISLIYFCGYRSFKRLVIGGFAVGLYALSRLITIYKEGMLGNFGTQWLVIESSLFMIALVLLSFKLRVDGVFKSI